MKYDAIVVGGGIAGLTTTSYLSKDGLKVLLCEKEEHLGGLVSSFPYKGFTIDGGIRSIEDSGIVMPMIRQLGLDIEFVRSTVTLGIENDVVRVDTKDSVDAYKQLLLKQFPENKQDIEKIIKEIYKIMKYMDILYGIDNPLFLDFKKDRKYLITTILPWVFKYLFTVGKVTKRNVPVEEYLQTFTTNQALIDMIAQHFFKNTPAFFALSYFSLYLDYQYPLGGTGTLVDVMKSFIEKNHGEIRTSTAIVEVNTEEKWVKTSTGEIIEYNNLVWAADARQLYRNMDFDAIKNIKTKQNVEHLHNQIKDLRGGDSILAVFTTVDLEKEYFENICTGHFFYTPYIGGLGSLKPLKEDATKEEMIVWLKEYYRLNTFEVSIPVLRDETLAPKGKTALATSTLFDYDIVKRIRDMGWYDEFKKLSEEWIIDILNDTIFPGFKDKITNQFSSTPLTIESRTGNTDGAITGWAFTNPIMPAVHKLPQIAKSVQTPLPHVFQAGQWSYSPAGLPISILTGKLAADKVKKLHKKG